MQLAMALVKSEVFRGKRLLIIEKDKKDSNDRTWSFWETGAGKWDHVVHQSWSKGEFHDQFGSRYLNLDPYRYKTIRSADFYSEVKRALIANEQVDWIQTEVKHIKDGTEVEIIADEVYRARHVFDSRIDQAFFDSNSAIKLWQHFKGWIIETEEEIFNPESFVMMDYRLTWQDTTSFMYILPTSTRRALVEFTFFSPEIVEERVYDEMIEKYLQVHLGQPNYTIVETEKGVIPMTDYPFHIHHQSHITKIGTAGGWVKPSSGYSFKNADRFAQKTIENLQAGQHPSTGIGQGRHRFFDRIFLDVLHKHNELGPGIFSAMYTKVSPQLIFKFLDEQTSLAQDLRIISSFQPGPFTRALFRRLGRKK